MEQSLENLFQPISVTSLKDAVAAILMLEDGRYLMQLRDDKPGVVYPGHWGLFGGAIDEGEAYDQAIDRELMEELEYKFEAMSFYTKMTFDLESMGGKTIERVFYEASFDPELLEQFNLGEGQAFKALSAREILTECKCVPYDAFAIWLHHSNRNGILN